MTRVSTAALANPAVGALRQLFPPQGKECADAGDRQWQTCSHPICCLLHDQMPSITWAGVGPGQRLVKGLPSGQNHVLGLKDVCCRLAPLLLRIPFGEHCQSCVDVGTMSVSTKSAACHGSVAPRKIIPSPTLQTPAPALTFLQFYAAVDWLINRSSDDVSQSSDSGWDSPESAGSHWRSWG
eukprot:Skav203088  [mRNA]  locus=scaffold447:145922:146467:+ [translate_table: standard]